VEAILGEPVVKICGGDTLLLGSMIDDELAEIDNLD
jgi:hypothetical protein